MVYKSKLKDWLIDSHTKDQSCCKRHGTRRKRSGERNKEEETRRKEQEGRDQEEDMTTNRPGEIDQEEGMRRKG